MSRSDRQSLRARHLLFTGGTAFAQGSPFMQASMFKENLGAIDQLENKLRRTG
jgi:hypothetical protein